MEASASSPLPRVLGRYALGEEIARGGMAAVHFGLVVGEAGFARPVAIKRLLPDLARDPEVVASFLDEAKLAARVRHPHVVPTLDVLSQDGEIFVVMEYVHGESLAALTRAAAGLGERIPVEVVSAIIAGALHGLHAAHEAKDERGAPLDLVHRDVTPQNVLVGGDGIARVLDFGIAKATGRSQVTREGQVKGKLGYMAPEQLQQRAERASDIYACGVCLWESLTMRRLFSGDNESVVLAKIMANIVDPPTRHAADLPPELDAIALRALHRDPAQRFATARDMARALEIAAPPAPAAEVGEWVERLVGPRLARRSERIAEMEASRRPATVAPPVAAPVTTPDVPVAIAPRPSSRRRWAWLASGGILLATGAILASVAHSTHTSATAEPTATATAIPSASAAAPEAAPAAPSPPPASASASAPPAVTVSARHQPRPQGAPRVDCNPPYSIGPDNVRHYKKQCLR